MFKPLTPSTLLPLDFEPVLSEDSFYLASSNQDAVAWIHRPLPWPGCALSLYGPPGSGKTHLGRIWAQRWGAQVLEGGSISREKIESVSPGSCWLLDDADNVVLAHPEHALHFYNRVVEQRGSWLMLSRQSPARWPLGLSDLASRLRALISMALKPPDDSLLEKIFLKLCRDRYILLDEASRRFVLTHVERSVASLQEFLVYADTQALAETHLLNRLWIRQVYERWRQLHEHEDREPKNTLLENRDSQLFLAKKEPGDPKLRYDT